MRGLTSARAGFARRGREVEWVLGINHSSVHGVTLSRLDFRVLLCPAVVGCVASGTGDVPLRSVSVSGFRMPVPLEWSAAYETDPDSVAVVGSPKGSDGLRLSAVEVTGIAAEMDADSIVAGLTQSAVVLASSPGIRVVRVVRDTITIDNGTRTQLRRWYAVRMRTSGVAKVAIITYALALDELLKPIGQSKLAQVDTAVGRLAVDP
jgi:hypothetical protein